MKSRFRKLTVFIFLWAATLNVSVSDSFRDISGTYKLAEINSSELPAVSWVDPGELCKEEVLDATMIVDSASRWAALVKVHKSCAAASGDESASTTESAIFTGSYKVSGNKIEFYDETLEVTDYASLEDDVLRYTAHGILKYEGQTAVFVFLRSNWHGCIGHGCKRAGCNTFQNHSFTFSVLQSAGKTDQVSSERES